jgi:hypothetical protein
MSRKLIINVCLFIFTVFAFTLGYYMNYWRVIDQDKFKSFDVYCQSQVLGRVIRAEKEGIFSDAGLNGWVRDDSLMKNMTWEDARAFQFDIYTKNLKLGKTNFFIYDTQIGGQAMLFSLIDKTSPFSNSTNLKLFWMITSLSLALLMSVFIFWVFKNYGFYPSLITFILLLSSPLLTIFGRNLYLIFSTFYLPFIIMLLLLHYESVQKTTISLRRLFIISSVLVFIKLLFTGFEFITTALVMFAVPLFYYLFLLRWKLNFFFKRFAVVVSGALSGTIFYVILYSYQLSTIKGSFIWGFKNILSSFLRRSYGNSADFDIAFKPSFESNLFDVLKIYLRSPALAFNKTNLFNIETLIWILIIFSLLSFLPKNISPTTYKFRKRNVALVLTTWVSILAPLSWYIIFKAHSFVHSNGFDDIVWCMPFLLFGFALIGSILSSLIKDIDLYYEKQYKDTKDIIA